MPQPPSPHPCPLPLSQPPAHRHRAPSGQHQFTANINRLHDEISYAWRHNERVTALKRTIQCAKMLRDTRVPAFYPSVFVLVTDILDSFGALVFDRLCEKAAEAEEQVQSGASKQAIERWRRACPTLPHRLLLASLPHSSPLTPTHSLCRVAGVEGDPGGGARDGAELVLQGGLHPGAGAPRVRFAPCCIPVLACAPSPSPGLPLPHVVCSFVELALLRCYQFVREGAEVSHLKRLSGAIRCVGGPSTAVTNALEALTRPLFPAAASGTRLSPPTPAPTCFAAAPAWPSRRPSSTCPSKASTTL